MISFAVFGLDNPLQQNIIFAEAMQVFTRPPHRDEVTVAEQGEDLVKHLSWQFVDVGLVVTLHSVEDINCCYYQIPLLDIEEKSACLLSIRSEILILSTN